MKKLKELVLGCIILLKTTDIYSPCEKSAVLLHYFYRHTTADAVKRYAPFKIIERYSLILFDFDKSELDAKNIEIAKDIKNKLKLNSVVKITGYTDRTGDAEYNRTLSLERAKATSKALGNINAKIDGLGESTLLYDNKLPEGRFYCRTVRVVVETILK